MTCKHCGTEIKDGLDYCLECGEPIEDKVVITTVKNIPIEAKPFLDFSGYVKALSSNVCICLSLLGAICLYLSPFMKWLEKTVHGENISGGLFDLGAKNGDMSIGDGKLCLFAVLILATGLYMLAMSGRKYIKPLMFCDNIIVRIVPVVLAIVILVLIMTNDTYSNYCKVANISPFTFIGPILFIVGILLYGISLFLEKKES